MSEVGEGNSRQGWLDGHVALMVGAGSGIGLATVDAFLTEGARVAVLEANADKCAALEERHPEVVVLHGDACYAEDNQRAVRETQAAFGCIDSATSFVGVFDHRASLAELAGRGIKDPFDGIFALNVRSALELAAAAAEPLAESNGSLLLTLSNSAFYTGGGGVLYIASKFALRGVVLQLAYELAPEIRVNGVAPGGTVDTDLRGFSALGTDDVRTADRPGRAENIRNFTPLRIAATPADHAGAYVYLASRHARAVTGVIVQSDGGLGVRP